jgi:putative membrane protein
MWDFGFMPMHGFGSVFMILFWIIVLVLLVFLLKSLFGNKSSESKGQGALALLNERYARGEINKETYYRIKNDIQN